MKEEYDDYFSRYEPGLALNAYQKYFWDYCDNYVEIAKHRLYNPDLYGEDAKKSAQKATYDSMLQLLKMGSVYLPHLTEEIYQDFFRDKEKVKSIHITDMDDFEYMPDQNLIEQGNAVVDAISNVRKYKSENNLSLRTPITSAKLVVKPENRQFTEQALLDIKNTTNIGDIQPEEGTETGISDIDIDWQEVERINEERRKEKELRKQKKAEEKRKNEAEQRKVKFGKEQFEQAYNGQDIQSNIIKDMLQDETKKEDDKEQTL